MYANFWNTLQQRTKWVRELYDLLLTSKEFVLPFANAYRISTTFKSEYKLCTRTFATGDGIKARQRVSQIISLNLPSKPSTPFNLQFYTPFYIHNLFTQHPSRRWRESPIRPGIQTPHHLSLKS